MGVTKFTMYIYDVCVCVCCYSLFSCAFNLNLVRGLPYNHKQHSDKQMNDESEIVKSCIE